MVPEKSAAQVGKAGFAYMSVWGTGWHSPGWHSPDSHSSRAEAARRAKEDSWDTTDFSWAVPPPSSYIPSLLRINVLVFCQPPFQPKGTPTHSHHYTGEIISSALKKKNKPTVKSQQKETTSVGCKMTKRKANECPGRGPAIAEKCNLDRGIRGAFAAKHMSRAVPETVCLFFSRSQLKKAVRALQAVFQFWPRDFAKQRDYSICMKIVLEAVRKNCSNEILICRCIYSWNMACK